MTTPAHPGQILAGKLAAIGVLPTELARQLHVPANRITQIIKWQCGIKGDSALRFAHWFSSAPEFWMGRQAQHELHEAVRSSGRETRLLPRQTTQADAQ
ncbi:HigA family addiction module antitoxin [Ideonella azotifigens]|uniref:HigA family addiction module antitoxin n=1 Tax=Ideonella azotifigens TaxID=513160 RepID=UPI00114311A0|nr:HigA family addiction module antitoxin [Ideonella azotifigens]MCD2341856.1 HigA family addiction module antitoxin [Ideonella azotifigens]